MSSFAGTRTKRAAFGTHGTMSYLESDFLDAARTGNTAEVKSILSDDKGVVNPAIQDNYAIKMAAANGHKAIVKLLLDDGRVDPNAADLYALRMAAYNGHGEIVDMLVDRARGLRYLGDVVEDIVEAGVNEDVMTVFKYRGFV